DSIIEMIPPGLIFGLVGSLIFIGLGIVVTPGILALMAVIYILSMFTFQPKYVSPVFAVGLTVLIAYFLPDVHTNIHFLDDWIRDIQGIPVTSVALLLGLLLITEG